jgi:tetratricopeptide (TPR) repeat protein
MSLTVRRWGEVQQVLRILESEDCEEIDVLPDQIPTTKVIMQRGRLGRHFLRGLNGPSGPRIGNDLHKLPETLKQNLYACLRSCIDGDDAPVESDIEALKHRISLIRLRHQADRLGALWNPSIPWALEQRKEEKESNTEGTVHPADLVPDSPSDWIPYDPEMCKAPWDFNNYFNTKDYGDFYRQHYYRTEDILPPAENLGQDSYDVASGEGKKSNAKSEDSAMPECDKGSPSKMVSSSEEEEDDGMKYILTVDNLLYETMLLLKDGGNAALQAGELDLAARRYDKAIQYGAVASMSFPVISLDFASGRKKKLKENGGYYLEWGPLIRVLIVSRLNLALLMLRPHFSQPEQTMEQAKLALHDLKPFCIRKGKVMKGIKLTSVFREDEPEETYIEAMTLQAKSFFRLGSAQYELGDYAAATTSYEKSVKSTQQANAKPDNLVLRRLSEAKRENRRKNKRHRKKFKFAFGANENELNG